MGPMGVLPAGAWALELDKSGFDSVPHKLDVRQGDHHKTQSPHI